jgi:predicted signal transduction protein with EAL and GGDEF domain
MNVFVSEKNTRVPSCCASRFECGSSIGAAFTTNTNDQTIVGSTLRMAHSLDLSVVAEGIEERTHYGMLRDLGCDVGQGYWIAKPMSADKLLAWADAWDRGRTLLQPVAKQVAG